MKLIKQISAITLVVVALAIVPVEAQTEKAHVIDAGGYTWLEWNFDEVTKVASKFRARGGNGNDIEIFILDEDGFENWRNGHRTPAYYNSGRVTVGRFDVNLRPGKYFFVMNNKFSVVSNKVVTLTTL